MAAVWEMNLPAKDKLILLAIADCANDEGLAWPSVATIARKCGCDQRTVQRNIRNLEKLGIFDREEVAGKGCKYRFKTPDNLSPQTNRPQTKTTQTPDNLPPKPSKNHTSSDATHLQKEARAKTAIPETFSCPDGVDPIDWDGLKANRRSKRAPFTEAAHRGIIKKLESFARDGWPPGPIVAHAAERGWVTVFETDEMKARKNVNRTNQNRQPQEPVNPIVRAAAIREAERRASAGHGVPRLAPSNQGPSG